MRVVGYNLTQVNSNQLDCVQYSTKGLFSYKFFGDVENPSLYIQSILKEIVRLDSFFQSGLRRVTFFVCNVEYCERFSGESNRSGFAMGDSNSILLTAHQNLLLFEELVRHELAHLYTLEWNRGPSRTLAEGMAMYLQQTTNGTCIDTIAKKYIHSLAKPVYLLANEEFDGEHRNDRAVYTNYHLTGSFTKYLISKYGKEAYLKFYSEFCPGDVRFGVKTNIERISQTFFGGSLSQLHQDWYEQLTYNSFSSRLKRTVRSIAGSLSDTAGLISRDVLSLSFRSNSKCSKVDRFLF